MSKKDLINVEHLGRLARLELEDDEKELLSSQLNRILEYVGLMQEANTDGIDLHLQTNDSSWRDDLVEEQSPSAKDNCRKAFPDSVGSALKVPAVFEDRDEIL